LLLLRVLYITATLANVTANAAIASRRRCNSTITSCCVLSTGSFRRISVSLHWLCRLHAGTATAASAEVASFCCHNLKRHVLTLHYKFFMHMLHGAVAWHCSTCRWLPPSSVAAVPLHMLY
jgi:hypothetical protein